MAARRRTRSSARRHPARNRRLTTHLVLGLILALAASALLYRAARDPIDPIVQASDGTTQAALAAVQTEIHTPSPTQASPAASTAAATIQPVDTVPAVVLTAIALESATPEPTQDPAEPLPTSTATEPLPPTATPDPAATQGPPLIVNAKPGDTLPLLAVRFGVQVEEISSPDPLPADGSLLTPGQLLVIPDAIQEETSAPNQLMPDSEVVYSPSAVGFDVDAFVAQAGGYLSTYKEYLGSTAWTTGADIIERVALENSINPRILLALLESRAHWIYGQPTNLAEEFYPLGILDRDRRGLFAQLNWAVDQLSLGYYGWREGSFTSLAFPDGSALRLDPGLNAGTVALQYLYSRDHDLQAWGGALYSADGLPAVYERMFGSPWQISQASGPLLPASVAQPELILPFEVGQLWSYTGGPHAAWNHDGARAAVDFAPASTESGCVKSNAWAVAAATGLVVRAGNGVVVLDLDGDGYEQTGWVLLYLHLAENGRVKVGDWVELGGHLGHPSCEGGISTGTHVHFARKYNGEWILADGPLPMVLSGWRAHNGAKLYEGTFTKDDQVVRACTCSDFKTRIMRPKD